MAHIINSGPSVFGWQCPVCLHVLGPQVGECPHCPAFRLDASLLTGYAGDALNRDEIAASRCEPSREGGMCGCGEPDDARQAVTPPASLASDPNGVRQVRLAGEWAEIFTGMQARFLDETRVWVDVEFRLTPADGQARD